MGQPDRRCGVFYDKLTQWQAEGRALRALLLETPLDEAFKWRQPAYVLGTENVAMFYGLKACCGISFFRGALLSNGAGMLHAPGPNSQAARRFEFRSLAEVEANTDLIRATIAEAIALHQAGEKVVFTAKEDLEIPEELIARLDDDPELAEAFAALTLGRKRGYAMHIAGAKQPKTRHARIDKHRPRILAGKGMHDSD